MTIPAKSVMTTELVTVSPVTTVAEAARRMLIHHVSAVAVVRAGLANDLAVLGDKGDRGGLVSGEHCSSVAGSQNENNPRPSPGVVSARSNRRPPSDRLLSLAAYVIPHLAGTMIPRVLVTRQSPHLGILAGTVSRGITEQLGSALVCWYLSYHYISI